MAKKPLIPNARDELDKMKLEVANEIGVHNNNQFNNQYKGNITSKVNGTLAGTKYVGNVGGQMVKRMIERAEQDLARQQPNQ
jgi:hypothetical protein